MSSATKGIMHEISKRIIHNQKIVNDVFGKDCPSLHIYECVDIFGYVKEIGELDPKIAEQVMKDASIDPDTGNEEVGSIVLSITMELLEKEVSWLKPFLKDES